MTPATMLAAGEAEIFKGSIHLALFSLASVCAVYNLGGLLTRPSRNLAVNAIVYGSLMALEARQTYRHFSTVNER